MTEISTRAQANSLQGMASGLNTGQIINKIMSIEAKRQEPVQLRRAEVKAQLESYNLIKTKLEAVNTSAKGLASSAMWEGKLVTSSDEKVITASASTGAKPGKHTLKIERLALNHQIASQGFPETNTVIGVGKVKITIGKEAATTVTIDESNNTLDGLKTAINSSNAEVTASIIKTGDTKKPYQLVLTSKNSGEAGRISIDVELKNGEPPNFKTSYDQPSDWLGVTETPAQKLKEVSGAGASTAIIRVVGQYQGEEDNKFTFTAVQSGAIGGDDIIQMRWEDEQGRSGMIDLDSFHYAPGEPVELVDGLGVVFSKGNLVVGDSFDFRTRSKRSSNFWWLNEKEKAAAYTQPSQWKRQGTHGAPVIGGTYTGKDGKDFKVTVAGSGQIGVSSSLALNWESSDGQKGTLRVGQGYTPGTPMALVDGITIALNEGVMGEGDYVEFSAKPAETSSKWWKEDSEREIAAEVDHPDSWVKGKEETDEVKFEDQFAEGPDFPEDLRERVSTAAMEVTGEYNGQKGKTYTFTAEKDGSIGVTKDLSIRWEDGEGNSGTIALGEGYDGRPVPFDSGLRIAFKNGRVYKTDHFTVRTRTATVQPAQDALVKLGATEYGGGLDITSPTNTLENVIEGLTLNLLATSDKPVTITVKGDTQKAVDSVLEFGKAYNDYATVVTELTAFDQDTKKGAPLLGDRDVANIKSQLVNAMIDPVKGLPSSSNMLMSVGLKINEKGLLEIDENILRKKVEEDFAQVAALFRDKGESSHNAVSVVGLTEDTKMNVEGIPLEISQVATQGHYLSPLIKGSIVLTDKNNEITVTVNGRDSEPLILEPGKYSLDEYAKLLQNAITNDKVVGKNRVRVIQEEGRVKVISGQFGQISSIAFKAPQTQEGHPPGLTDGESVAGQDVQGTIGGKAGVGAGQVLKPDETDKDTKGLRLFVTLNESQLMEDGPEAVIKITKGVASRVSKYLGSVVDAKKGEMKRITEGLRMQDKTYEQQLNTMKERMERKRAGLQQKFAHLEGQMSRMKNQQNYMAGQLASLPSSASAALPGL